MILFFGCEGKKKGAKAQRLNGVKAIYDELSAIRK